MPFKAEHSCRLRSPVPYRGGKGICRRDPSGNIINIVCRTKKQKAMIRQAIRYPKSKWSTDDARANCNKHHGEFHPAKG